jgi:N-methylhydantoinase A
VQVVGIDTGGTFTDFVAEGRVVKVRSTPRDPAQAFLDGLRALGLDGPLRLVHGTTVGTNALLTKSYARTAFVATEGVEDLIEIGRQDRRDLYAILPTRHDPIARDRFGVRERLRADGSIDTPLDIGDLVERVRASGAQAVAVCLLHAYRNPAHERAVGEALAALKIPVALSHVVANEFREFERAATTVANAALMPVVGPYLRRLERELKQHRLEVLQSSGGTATAAEAAELPVRTILSGPAGGVVATTDLLRRHGIEEGVSFDMGGTSTDVALIRGGLGGVMPEFRLEGLPLRVPVLDVHTVGAGGGSLARIDALGVLRVGPESAGADPGPACYGVGREPTVTDAHVVLGHLSENDLLAGTLRIDAGRAHSAIGRLGAMGILRVADATMERALRTVTVRRGIDPRPCTLVAFGGAGPLHACALADALGMRDILVPVDPGAFSAHGMRSADRRRDFVRTVLLDGREVAARLPELFAPLRQGDAALEIATADARYAGQSHELPVTADADLVARFHDAHERAFGYCDRTRNVEVTNLRLAAIDPAPRLAPLPPRPPSPPARRGPKRMARAELEGAVLGPTVLTEVTATTIVPAGWQARALADGTLHVTRCA